MNVNVDRKGVIDALRGYFIIWIGLYNSFAVFNAIQPNLVLSSILLFINDKGWFCLSAIFGYGFGVIIKKKSEVNFGFIKRMFLLFVLGVFNNMFFYGDILKEYALIGLLLYFTKKFSNKYPFQFFLIVLILTLSSLYFIPFDMQKAGELKGYFIDKNVILGNLKYCLNLNTNSLYFGFCYHLEMLLMASMGYLMALYNLGNTVLLHRRKLRYFSLFSIVICLSLIFFVFQKDNPLLKIAFFIYIFSLSVFFVLIFYHFSKQYKWFISFFSVFGRRSLTIYLMQNFLICTIWLWDETPDFFLYCFGQILILFLIASFTKNGIGVVEYYWRKLSLT